MQTAIFRRAGQPLVIEIRPDPIPGPGQVVIRVARCGICGSDTHMTSGSPFDFAPGSAPGHEYAGEVVALGPAVQRLRVGDRIAAMPMQGCGQCLACLQGHILRCPAMQQMMGGFGEYTLVAERSAIVLPASLSMSDGALVEPLACGLHAVRLAQLPPGASVVIIGAGAIGLAVAYWARRLGAGSVTVVARSDLRYATALAMGASAFVASATLTEPLGQALQDAHGSAPAWVFECSGAPGMLATAIDMVSVGGTLVLAGMCSHPETFVPLLANYKELRLQFAVAYTLQDFQLATSALDAGAVEPRTMITDTISLQELPACLEAMRQPHPQCKVMVDPWRGVAVAADQVNRRADTDHRPGAG